MNRQELNEAIENTKLEIYRLKYELGGVITIKEEKKIHKKLRELQILHYWQLGQLKRMEENK